MRKYNIKRPGVLIRQCSKWRCPPRDSFLQLEKKLYCKTFLQLFKTQSVHFYLCRSHLLSLLFSSCFVCPNSVRLSFPKDERCRSANKILVYVCRPDKHLRSDNSPQIYFFCTNHSVLRYWWLIFASAQYLLKRSNFTINGHNQVTKFITLDNLEKDLDKTGLMLFWNCYVIQTLEQVWYQRKTVLYSHGNLGITAYQKTNFLEIKVKLSST